MSNLAVGAVIPLTYQLGGRQTDKYVRATVKNAAGNQISGSPVSLSHDARGQYVDSSLTMPNTAYLRVQYEVFTDSGFTTPFEGEGSGAEVFIRAQESTGGGGDTTVVSEPLVGFVSNQAIVGYVEECE